MDSSPADKKLLHKSQIASRITIHRINCCLSCCHGDNLREQLAQGSRVKLKTMVENNKRSRKPNFTAAEWALICDAAEQNLSVIKSKFSSAFTKKNKTEVWEDITARVNSLGVCLRSVAEVKDKWRGMVSTAKKEHTKYAASQRQTGGGKKPASPVSATKKITDLFGEDPAFSGIAGGVESGKQTTISIFYRACRSWSNYKIVLSVIFPLWLNWKTEVLGSQFESMKQTFSCFVDAKCFFVHIHDTEKHLYCVAFSLAVSGLIFFFS